MTDYPFEDLVLQVFRQGQVSQMSFLSLTALQAFLFALVTIGTVLALFFLKLHHRRVLVGSALLWQKVLHDRQANSLIEKLRRLLSLLLALTIAFADCVVGRATLLHSLRNRASTRRHRYGHVEIDGRVDGFWPNALGNGGRGSAAHSGCRSFCGRSHGRRHGRPRPNPRNGRPQRRTGSNRDG